MFRGTIGCIVLSLMNVFEADMLNYIVGACLSFIGITYGTL
jgi:hypothetical protein